MSNTAICSTADSRIKFWFLLLAFAAIYLLFRLPWLSCDPGVPSLWEYGYNATDEGYYLSGGKEKFLWGYFVDLSRSEASTYGYSAGTHWLSYLSYLLFGLSTWAWRLPFFAICLCAWLTMFCHVARKAGAVASFVLCTSISMIPMLVAYERTASNDVLIGALVVMSYVCATGRSRFRIIAAGMLLGLVALVKPSVWVLLPVAASGVAQDRGLRSCVKGLAVFLCAAVATTFVCKGLVAWSVVPDAARAGVSVWEILKRTTAHYALPSVFDFVSHFKGLSSFPRDPSTQLLGAVAPLVCAIPFALAARNALSRRWNGHFLLFLAIPAYIAAVSVMNTIYTHYFIPAIMLLPILLSAAVSDHGDDKAEMLPEWWRTLCPLLAVLALCAVGTLFLASYSAVPSTVQDFYSRIYNFPAKNVWGMTWPIILAFVVLAVAVLAVLNGVKVARTHVFAWTAAALVMGSVVFAPIPAVVLAPYMKKASGEYFAPMVAALVTSALFLAVVFDMKSRFRRKPVVICLIPAIILLSYLFVPTWRTAFFELARPGTHDHASVARELGKILPHDAIVLGERSNQMLMSLPIRTASTILANSDPIPVIESILKADPNAKLYALVDSQHAYNLQHYREHANEYRLRHVKTFKMPSFGNGSPADVYLCEIHPMRK